MHYNQVWYDNDKLDEFLPYLFLPDNTFYLAQHQPGTWATVGGTAGQKLGLEQDGSTNMTRLKELNLRIPVYIVTLLWKMLTLRKYGIILFEDFLFSDYWRKVWSVFLIILPNISPVVLLQTVLRRIWKHSQDWDGELSEDYFKVLQLEINCKKG